MKQDFGRESIARIPYERTVQSELSRRRQNGAQTAAQPCDRYIPFRPIWDVAIAAVSYDLGTTSDPSF
jgi:hypothetical protein